MEWNNKKSTFYPFGSHLFFYLERLFLAAGLPDGLPDLLLTEELERALFEPALKKYLDNKVLR